MEEAQTEVQIIMAVRDEAGLTSNWEVRIRPAFRESGDFQVSE